MTANSLGHRVDEAATTLYHGDPFWLTDDLASAEYSELPSTDKCDIAIVGAGITGALTEQCRSRAQALLEVSIPSIDNRWLAIFAGTRDALSLIGTHPNDERVYIAMAYGGNGITFAALAADSIARHLAGEPISLLLSPGRGM